VQEPIPGIEYEFGLHQRFLPEITLEEINTLAKDWVPDRNRVVMISAPQKEGLTVPGQEKLAAVIASATTKEIKPYIDVVDTQPLLDSLPEPGAMAKYTTRDAVGITEWELSNGARVVLKPTTFKEDEVLFRATSPGGTSLATDQDYVAASTAAQVIGSGGVGKFSAIELRKMLSGKVASVRPIIAETEEGVTGRASSQSREERVPPAGRQRFLRSSWR
jgi:zinc protease